METRTKNKTVLLVDDDHEDQEIFEDVVNQIDRSVNCVFVDTAEDALEKLSTADLKPDYIFLDLNLPFMTGFDCLYIIKKNDRLQDIPVIIYSTSTRESDKQKAKELGASNYLSKASTFSEIKSMLANVIN
ncbi:MAG: response regulator [Segetibacter sp.]|jgi:CheY-like chemotaxis protein|nr:response regulator [Segetibacter sp.]